MAERPQSTRAVRVVIVLPAHNEEESLLTTLQELWSALLENRELPTQYEVVVVDDGSTDSTRAIARSYRVTVLTHVCNLGYGGAVSTGLKYAWATRADATVIMDADGQHDPRSVPDLLRPVLRGDADIAIGSRFVGGVRYRTSLARHIGSAIFGIVLSAIARRRIYDTTSGFQCIGPRALPSLARTYPIDYPDAQVILQLVLSGMRVVEVPTTMRPRTAGQSMHSWMSIFQYPPRMLLSLLVVLLRFGLQRMRGTTT